MKRAIAFIRVSTDSQDDGERQIIQIRKYCITQGYNLLEDETIQEIISGTITERDGLTELLNLTPADCDLVIVSESSRLSRDASMLRLPVIVETVQSRGLDLLILGSSENKVYPANTLLNPMEVMYLVFEAYKNREEIKTSKMRFKTGKEKMAGKGGFIGHKMPLGYRVAEGYDKKNLTGSYHQIVEKEAEVIRLIFDLVGVQGYSAKRAADYLQRTDVITWHSNTILRILKNPIYKGEGTIMGQPIKVPEIITKDLFETVQIKIQENFLFSNKGNTHFNELKGIAKCACGCSLYLHKTGMKRGENNYFHYHCYSKNSSNIKEGCKNKGIESNFLNSIVWSVTKSYINIDDFTVKTEQLKKSISLELKALARLTKEANAEKAEILQKIESLTDAIEKTMDTNVVTILSTRLSKQAEELKKADKEIGKLNNESQKLTIRLRDLGLNLLPKLVNSSTPEERNEIFVKYLDKVTYYSVNQNRGFVVVGYKNGAEAIVVTKTRPNYEAYRLPQGFKFNPANSSVLSEGKKITSAIATLDWETTEFEDTYSQLFERYEMNEFKMEL